MEFSTAAPELCVDRGAGKSELQRHHGVGHRASQASQLSAGLSLLQLSTALLSLVCRLYCGCHLWPDRIQSYLDFSFLLCFWLPLHRLTKIN